MNYVLDACAMIAYLYGEDGGDVVERLLHDPQHRCHAHAINLCEVYYDVHRRAGSGTAESSITDPLADGIVEHRDMDPAFWRVAGSLKAQYRLSLADSFCTALGQRLTGEVVTSDRREFGPLQVAGICPILFIR